MPTQGTQVYWHQLPEKVSPWLNTAELRACIQESRQMASSAQQGPLDTGHDRKRRRRGSRHQRALWALQQQRLSQFCRLERPRLHRGVVPEPHATPLRVINVVMAHLGQRVVTTAEAEAAVDVVLLRYNTLTQQSQTQPAAAHSEAEATAGKKRRRASQRSSDPVAAATASVLSQSQRTDILSGTQPSLSQTTKARDRGISAGLQDALLLDVVAELCRSRALRFKRFTRAELGERKYNITSVETVPHKRVVLLADRRDPYFVVLFSVPRDVRPDPYVVATLALEGRRVEDMQRYKQRHQPYTHLFCVAPAPVPWRHLRQNVSISAFKNEFAAAVVEVDEAGATDDGGSGDGGDQGRDAPFPSPSSEVKAVAKEGPVRDASASRAADKPGLQRRPAAVLGASESDTDSDNDDDGLLFPMPSAAAMRHSPPARRATAADGWDAIEARWTQEEAMFDETSSLAATAAAAAETVDATRAFAESAALGDGGSAGQVLDPLQRLPRTDVRDHSVHAKHRVWYRRLLDKAKSNKLIEILRSQQPDDF